MKLKNKMTLSLGQLVQKTEKEGGIPDCVEFDLKEGAQLLRELNRMKASESIKERYKITTSNPSIENALMVLYRNGLDANAIKRFMERWSMGLYQITFDDIPLKLIVPKSEQKQVTTRPAQPAPAAPATAPNNGELTLSD